MPETGKSCSDRLIGYCLGNIYYQPVEDEAFQKLRQNAIEALLDIFEGKLPFKWAKSIGRDRQAAKESLGFMLAACHDVLNKKTGVASGSYAALPTLRHPSESAPHRFPPQMPFRDERSGSVNESSEECAVQCP